MQHERLRRFSRRVDGVEALHVVGRAERGRYECLRLPAREQRGAMRARKNTAVDADWADFVRRPPVHALLRAEHLRPKGRVFQIAEDAVDLLDVVWQVGEELI